METFPTWGKELYKTLQNLKFAYVLGGKKKENQSTREKIHKKSPPMPPQKMIQEIYSQKNNPNNQEKKKVEAKINFHSGAGTGQETELRNNSDKSGMFVNYFNLWKIFEKHSNKISLKVSGN